MRLTYFPVDPVLKSYVQKLWVFEADEPIPGDDMKLVVPNGLIKLVIPYRNGLTGKMTGCCYTSMEHQITLIGISDIPSNVETAYFNGRASGTIGVEFSPSGAHRIFNLRLSEIKNQICSLDDIISKTAGTLQEQIANTERIEHKVAKLQHFFMRCLTHSKEDSVFSFCVNKIRASNGTIPVSQLERETGYSSRWLNLKFTEKLGVSPKNFAAIVRFQQYYQALAMNKENSFFSNDFYNYYYDQSHFIKDFRRFTGMAPTHLANSKNDFGEIFYKE